MNDINGRLRALRETFDDLGVSALVVPTQDPHFSEYPPAHFQTRAYFSGFHGSAGTLVVSRSQAGLWTDSRYFLEAEEALSGTEVDLYRMQAPGVPRWSTWLCDTLEKGHRVGIDARLLSLAEESRLSGEMESRGIELAALTDPVDATWRDRPPLPANPVTRFSDQFVGESSVNKLTAVRREIGAAGATRHLVSTLDDIAWILNLRGSDVDFNPVFLAYLFVSDATAVLFCNSSRLSTDVMAYLAGIEVEVAPYESLVARLAKLDARDGAVLLDSACTSVAVRDALPAGLAVIQGRQPSTLLKARKHPREIDHVQNAMRRDGATMVRFLRWIDERVSSGKPLDELAAAQTLTTLRAESENFVSNAFRPISAVGPHAAIPHYSVNERTSATIVPPAVYLVDSGGQYLDGTTDITRTIALGEVSDQVREDFALVLRGMISLSEVRFPSGWAGRDLDAVARLPMWHAGRNFGHGTGHGVGYYLNVHEGPQRIAPTGSDTPLEPGMIVSDEPGVYREGEYGIRIENLLVVREDESTQFGDFLAFDTLTLCPIDRAMIDPALYSQSELAWIDAYHRRVYDELAPLLEEADRQWLRAATRPFTAEE